MSRERKSTLLRERLKKSGALVGVGVYDALSARIAELCGFEVVHHSGFGTAATLLGAPDIGLLDFTEMCQRVKSIARAVSIPVLGDADTGYGNPLNVYRTVHEYIWAGSAGLFIEDQRWPKRCGHMEGKEIIGWDEMKGKLEAAIDAKRELDPDFVIIYRTDAVAVAGIEEAVARGNAAAALGVDMVFVEALESKEQMERAVREIDAPLMLNLIEGGKTPLFSVKEAESMGFKYIVFALTPLFSATKGMIEALSHLKKTGSSKGLEEKLVSFDQFTDIVKLKDLLAMEKKYAFDTATGTMGNSTR